MLYFALGLSIGFIICVYVMHSYKRTLILCAKLNTPEKLPDGKFYYIVRESKFIELAVEANHYRDYVEMQLKERRESVNKEIDTLLNRK